MDAQTNRTVNYTKASKETQIMIDNILSIINNLPINEAKEILRIASNEVYTAANKLESTLKFIQS